MRTLAAAALVAVLLCALQAVRATNTDDIYYAMDAIDSGWGLGFRNKFGDPAKTCNCSFVGGVRISALPPGRRRRHANPSPCSRSL